MPSHSMASSLPDSNVRPHDRFFFSDGSLYLLVENSLYCVHKFLFEIHATMSPVRGLETSLNKPHVLSDVKKSDFDCFLANFYPRTPGVEEAVTTQDWLSVLGLASKWGFNSLRSRAILKIEQTLESPVDMVTLGRQYDISAFLLPGYAVLCQSTTPLSDEEGLRLGMEDVLKIYRIRHELYGSDITPVPLDVAFTKVKEAGLAIERPTEEHDGEQASTWTDDESIHSVATSHTFTTEKEERGAIGFMPNAYPSPSDVASTRTTTFVSKGPEQQHIDGHSPSDEPTSGALGNRGSKVSSVVFPGNVSDMNSRSSVSTKEGFRLMEELAMSDLNLISSDIVQWVNTTDIQTLHQITRLVVEKAIEVREHYHPCVRLCKAMVKYTQTLCRMTRLIVENAMEEPPRFTACARLCNMMVKDTNGRVTADGSLFCEYLGETCQKNLETVAALVAANGELVARVRRRRLIEFIGTLVDLKAVDMWAPTIIDEWVAALLDANNEEKVATLCMVMTRAGRLCTSRDMNSWLESVKNVAQVTSKPRVRKLLQDVTKRGSVTWVVAEPSEDCAVQ